MSNILTLIKYNFINGIGYNRLNKKKKSFFGTTSGILVLYALILLLVTYYINILSSTFESIGETKFILLGVFLIGLLTSFLSTISKAGSYIFKTTDYDIVMSMPIKHHEFVISKLISLYLLNFFMIFTFYIPTIISYTINHGFDSNIYITYFILLIFTPCIPMTIACLFSFLFGFIPLTQKVKNLVTTLISLIVLVIFIYFYVNYITDVSSAFNNLDKIKYGFFFTKWIYTSFEQINLGLLYFIQASLLSIILYSLLIGKFFDKINSLFSRQKVNTNYKLKDEKEKKEKGEIKTVFYKELTLYINIPTYVLNTIIGPLFSIFALVATLINKDSIMSYLSMEENTFTIEHFYSMFCFGIIFFISISSTTASAISLEGKSLWVLKSSPIKTSSIFIGKSLLNITINGIVIILNTILLGIFLKINIIYIILFTLLPLLYNVSISFLGLYINLLNPKFDFDNPIKVIKQSMAVFKTTIIGTILGIIIVGVGIFLSLISIPLALVVSLIIASLFLWFNTTRLFKKGVNLFNNLDT